MTTTDRRHPAHTLYALLLLAVAGSAQAQLSQPILTTDRLVQGQLTAEGSVISVFRGLPYAAPPVGANRWR